MTDFAELRTTMVDTQVRPNDVTKFPIIEAMLSVPKEAFVPDGLRAAAYVGENVDLGRGRVVLEARTFAKMLDALDIGPDDRALVVGCGLGYSAAVIARMAGAVVGLEQDHGLADGAAQALAAQGVDRVTLRRGPLAEGAADAGPFDVIVIEGAVEVVPDAILAQLAEGGRIASLFAEGSLGVVRIGVKGDGTVSWRSAFNAGAPVLDGFRKRRGFVL
jgi:protein-L-isoaspartate(D-aspartate) O-methyltransferase